MISQETIAEIKEKARLMEVASEYLQLKRQGTRYLALCPFHAEKTPSFHIRDDQNAYHCFGCGVSGNVISFLMQIKGISFPEAVEDLAARYGISVQFQSTKTSDESQKVKKEIFRVNALAKAFYQYCLKQAPASVIEYMSSRGLNEEAVVNFSIGFAPQQRDALSNALVKKKVPADLIVKSGLARRNDRGELYDTFRGRLIFPINLDARRTCAFGGRLIPALFDSDPIPKYINSPESPVYDKSKTFFGQPQALSSIRADKEVYIVEGYLDVISLWLNGIQNVLATCGTALTPGHINSLSRLCRKVIVLFDGDVAGRNAAGKSFLTFINSDVQVQAVFLDEKEDPDSIARKYGLETRSFISSLTRIELLDCYIDMLCRKQNAQSVSDLGDITVSQIAHEVASALSQITEPIVRDRLSQRAAFKLRIKEELFSATLKGAAKPHVITTNISTGLQEESSNDFIVKEASDLSRLERELLKALMVHRETLPQKLLRDTELTQGLHACVLQFAQALVESMANEESVQKAQIREILKRFGPSWERLWREAYQMSENGDVNLSNVFEDCRIATKKSQIIQAIKRTDGELLGAKDESERLLLIQDKLSFSRQLQGL